MTRNLFLKPNTLATPATIAIIGIALAILPLKFAAAIVIGGIGAIVLVLRPKLAVYGLIFAIPFSSYFQIGIGGAHIGVMELLLVAMLTIWLLQMAARREIIIPQTPLLVPFLIFLGAIGLSWLGALSFSATLTESAKWLEMLALYLFIVANFKRDETPWLVSAILLAGAIEAALGIYQFVFKIGPDGFLLFGGRFLRAYGSFRQPNPFAGYLGLILPLTLAIFLWAVGQIQQKTANTIFRLSLLGGVLAILLAGLFASQSRGGMLGFAIAATVTVLLMGGRWAFALGIAFVGGALFLSMGGLAFVPHSIVQRFADAVPYIGVSDVAQVVVTDANFATIERLAHWQAAQEMWRDNLWLGVGFGNYAAVYGAYAVGRWLDPLGHAHNYLLNIGAEAGLVGILGYFVFWGWVFVFAIKKLRFNPLTTFQRAIIAGSVGIFVHLHIHNLFDNLYVQGMYLHVAIIFALITLVVFNEESTAK